MRKTRFLVKIGHSISHYSTNFLTNHISTMYHSIAKFISAWWLYFVIAVVISFLLGFVNWKYSLCFNSVEFENSVLKNLLSIVLTQLIYNLNDRRALQRQKNQMAILAQQIRGHIKPVLEVKADKVQAAKQSELVVKNTKITDDIQALRTIMLSLAAAKLIDGDLISTVSCLHEITKSNSSLVHCETHIETIISYLNI
jgi:ABC-type multidrug transport system fused ATPase/permease subunit